jgi:uncharacterized protein (UPF0548 family)
MAFSLLRPDAAVVPESARTYADAPFSYDAVGATRAALPTPPTGFEVDHNRVLLGTGAETYARAKAALRRWTMFPAAWLDLLPVGAPQTVGTVVAIRARGCGLWSLNRARPRQRPDGRKTSGTS